MFLINEMKSEVRISKWRFSIKVESHSDGYRCCLRSCRPSPGHTPKVRWPRSHGYRGANFVYSKTCFIYRYTKQKVQRGPKHLSDYGPAQSAKT